MLSSALKFEIQCLVSSSSGSAIKSGSMVSSLSSEEFQQTLKSCIDGRVALLKELEEKRTQLKTQLDVLNGKRQDTNSRRRLEVRPGKRVKQEVDIWLNNVKDINEKIEESEKEIEAMYCSLSPARVIEDILEKMEKSSNHGSGEASSNIRANNMILVGLGGIGNTQINSRDSTTNINVNLHTGQQNVIQELS